MIKYSSSDILAYKTVITEIDSRKLETTLQVFLILLEYSYLAYVFLQDTTNTLLEYGDHDLCLKTTSMPSFEPLYKLSQNELEIFQVYIADNLAKRFIKLSTLSIDAYVLFIKKRYEIMLIY